MKRLPDGSLFLLSDNSLNMRPLKILIFSTLLVIYSLAQVKSQVSVGRTDILLDQLRLNRGNEGNIGILYKDIEGDPYIFRDFQKGILYIEPEGKYNVKVRYDIFADQMHLKDSNMIYGITQPFRVKLIEAGNYKFLYSVFVDSPDDNEPTHSSYFVIKTEGKCRLLIKKSIRVQDAEPAKLYQEAKPPKFVVTADTYYLKTDGNSAVRIKNKKDLLAVLADKADAIDSYISSNKLGVKDSEDLAKIVSFYNSL
jgi:hypothetical protein